MSPYDENSPILGTGTLTLEGIDEYLGVLPRDEAHAVWDYIDELRRLCVLVGFNDDLLLAQALHETANFTSPIWRTRLNPVGLGVTDGGDDGIAFATGTDAARAHVAHMWAYTKGQRIFWSVPDDNALAKADPRFDNVFDAGYAGTVRTLGDLTGKWATDPGYATKIAAKANALVASAQKGAPMTTPATIDYSRLPVPVIVDLIPESQPNQNPGIPMNPTSGTWHETANYAAGADALMHQRWINGGASGTQTSWHFTVDDKRIVQHIPLNRVAWHGGDSATGLGPSTKSIAVECCVNDDGDLAKAQENTAALFGLLYANDIIEAVYQHNKWSGKDCPRLLRQGKTMTWSQAQALINKYDAQYSNRPPEPKPIWWTPGEDVGIVTRESDDWKANAMHVQTYATTKRAVPVFDQIGGTKIAEIAPGKPAVVGGTTRAKDAKASSWYFVKVDGGWGRARGSSFLDKLPLP